MLPDGFRKIVLFVTSLQQSRLLAGFAGSPDRSKAATFDSIFAQDADTALRSPRLMRD